MGIKDVMRFFNYDSVSEFQKDWKELDDADKAWFLNNTPIYIPSKSEKKK